MTTAIDLSRVPPPAAIERLSFEGLNAAFVERFKTAWAAARVADPTLPDYDVQMLETDPVVIIGQAWSYIRLLDRQRVNDAVAAVLAPLATGTNLDNVAASRGILRLVVVPATSTSPAVMEGDAALLRRYLLTFDRAGAGSAGRYLFEAWTAWPAMLDAKVNGQSVHGRRGDTDVVIIGPDGRLPTETERQAVRAAVTAPDVKPEAVAVSVLAATRLEYAVSLVVELPVGPDPSVVVAEVEARVRSAALERMVIGGEVPFGLLSGAAYGPSVITVRDLAPVVIETDPYTVPVMTDLMISVEVR